MLYYIVVSGEQNFGLEIMGWTCDANLPATSVLFFW